MKKLVLLAAMLMMALVAAVPIKAQVEQETEQEAESGDVEIEGEVASQSESVNRCVALLQAANTGNLQNSQGATQHRSASDDVEDEGNAIALSPALKQACVQTIQQAAAAGKGEKTVPASKVEAKAEPSEIETAETGPSKTEAETDEVEATMEQKKEERKELPKTGGMGSASLLGMGALLVVVGLLANRIVR